ncbi:MAG: carboxypeptidase-like regulatory domain-containing protein [Bacteroidota bacterium]
MKIKKSLFFAYPVMFLLSVILSGNIFAAEPAEIFQQTKEFKGVVVDSRSGDEIASAYLTVVGTNISTITNADGEFSIKVPVTLSEGTITISHLGYQSKTLPLSFFRAENTKVELDEIAEQLSEISIYDGGDAQSLVKKMFDKKEANYTDEPILMTAFYRETIKKGRRNVSLSEAVVKIYKAPYDSFAKDEISLFKTRKTADYEKLDTLALKLRGGPYNTLYVDVIKYPQYLIDPDMLQNFKFNFDAPVRFDDRNLYVVNFESNNKSIPWYYGKLFIDTETLSLVKATYNLNVDNRNMASQMFVRKKPRRATVYPIDVSYQVDYRQNNGKWQYGYGTANLVFVVNWKNKLFNSRYTVNGEMAVTNWETLPDFKIKKDDTFINPSVVMSDDVSGFTDVDFWGNNNIIEPEKSIQNAIEKIKRQLQD